MPQNRREFFKNIAALSPLLALPALAKAPEFKRKKSQNKYSFFGTHQQGITTPAQKHIYFLVLDLHTNDANEIKEVFKTWSKYATNLCEGKNVAPYSKNALLPPLDTGEADDLSVSSLTLTFGVSPSFFTKLKIEHLKPKDLEPLPHFARDQIKPEFSGGDICIQACADDLQVAFHAVRNLVRVARTKVTMKWAQSGFNSYEGEGKGAETPRNLFAFKDGTINPKDEQKVVWINDNTWLKNGSYLIVRKTQMHLETWDRTHLKGQNDTFGRDRFSGAAFGKKGEFDETELYDKNGSAILPTNSHVFLAKSAGVEILRRSFSYLGGIEAGRFDAGLIFIAFCNNPANFIAIQNTLGNTDRMNEYITNIGSGIFACFGGVSKEKDDYIGKALFEQI